MRIIYESSIETVNKIENQRIHNVIGKAIDFNCCKCSNCYNTMLLKLRSADEEGSTKLGLLDFTTKKF